MYLLQPEFHSCENHVVVDAYVSPWEWTDFVFHKGDTNLAMYETAQRRLAGSAHSRKSGHISDRRKLRASLFTTAKIDIRRRPLSFCNLKQITCLRWYKSVMRCNIKTFTVCWYSLLLSIYKKSISLLENSPHPGQCQ